MCAQSLTHVWVCGPTDFTPSGSSDHGIFQVRILEWVAISSSRRSFWPRDPTHFSYHLHRSGKLLALSHLISPLSVQFSGSVLQFRSSLWPCDCSTPGLLVHHQFPEFTPTHVHWVGDTIQPSHPLSSHSPPALNPSQHQSLFQWVNSLHEVAKVLEFQL